MGEIRTTVSSGNPGVEEGTGGLFMGCCEFQWCDVEVWGWNGKAIAAKQHSPRNSRS